MEPQEQPRRVIREGGTVVRGGVAHVGARDPHRGGPPQPLDGFHDLQIRRLRSAALPQGHDDALEPAVSRVVFGQGRQEIEIRLSLRSVGLLVGRRIGGDGRQASKQKHAMSKKNNKNPFVSKRTKKIIITVERHKEEERERERDTHTHTHMQQKNVPRPGCSRRWGR